MWDKVWRGLQAGRLLTKDMVIEGTDYRYWKDQCRDLTDKQINAGYRASSTFKGYFTIGEFKSLCIEAYQKLVEQNRRPVRTTARLSDLRTFGGDDRWVELALVTQAMNAEEGEGPITRASRENKLTKHVIRGKSADEIISFCHDLYS